LYSLVDRWRSNVAGFNVLRFGIPLLIQKGVEHGVGDLAELNRLWHSTYTIDYFQTTLPLHGMKFRGLKLEYLAEIARRAGAEVPKPLGSGQIRTRRIRQDNRPPRSGPEDSSLAELN